MKEFESTIAMVRGQTVTPLRGHNKALAMPKMSFQPPVVAWSRARVQVAVGDGMDIVQVPQYAFRPSFLSAILDTRWQCRLAFPFCRRQLVTHVRRCPCSSATVACSFRPRIMLPFLFSLHHVRFLAPTRCKGIWLRYITDSVGEVSRNGGNDFVVHSFPLVKRFRGEFHLAHFLRLVNAQIHIAFHASTIGSPFLPLTFLLPFFLLLLFLSVCASGCGWFWVMSSCFFSPQGGLLPATFATRRLR
jgi:hypothetical protein